MDCGYDARCHEGQCAIVSVTTLRNSKGQTIILRPGDHPCIRHDSTIFDGDGMIVDARKLDQDLSAGLIVAREKCPAARLKLVQDGIKASPFTRPRFLRFCREAW